MKNLIAKFFASGSEPSELERVVLTAVRRCLSPDAVSVWDKQFRVVNKIQRLPDGVEVNFYRMEKGKATFDPAISFPNKTEELLLAKVRLRIEDAGPQLEASMWAVGGFVFSIEYGAGSKYFEEILGADPPVKMEVACQLLCDPSIEQ